MRGVYNKDLQKLQALMMIQMKLGQNMSYEEIGKAMNIHRDTVERRFVMAEKAGIFVELQAQIMNRLVPKAMDAIETALADGDAETAMELLKSVGVLRDPKAPRTVSEQNQDDELMLAINGIEKQKKLEAEVVDGAVIGRSGLAGLLEDAGDTPAQAGSGETRDAEQPRIKAPAETASALDSPK